MMRHRYNTTHSVRHEEAEEEQEEAEEEQEEAEEEDSNDWKLLAPPPAWLEEWVSDCNSISM